MGLSRIVVFLPVAALIGCGATPPPPTPPPPDLSTLEGRLAACEPRARHNVHDLDAHRCWRQGMLASGRRGELVATLATARQAQPQLALHWYHEGMAWLAADPVGAQAHFEACLAAEARPAAWCALGHAQALAARGDGGAAGAALAGARALPPRHRAPAAVTVRLAAGHVDLAELALSDAPEHVSEVRLARAEVAWAKGEEDAANTLLNLVVARRPDDPAPLRLRARIHGARGLVDAALADLRAALQRDVGDDAVRRELAERLLAAERFDAAVDPLQRLVDRFPDSAEYRVWLGRALLETGAEARALAWADSALELEPRRTDAVLLKARALIKAGQISDALALRQRLFQGPQAARHRIAFAEALLRAREGRRAESEFAAAVAAHPDDVLAWTAYARWLRAQLRPAGAVDVLNQALSRQPGAAPLHAELARVRELVEDMEGAKDAMRHAALLDPENADYEDELARLHFMSGDLAGGVQRWTRLVKRDPNAERAMVRLAHAHRAMRDHDAAEAMLRRVLVRKPDDPELKGRLGEVLLIQGRKEAAIPLLRAAVAGGATIPHLRAFLATALADTGTDEEARQAFAEALAHDPADRALRMTYAAFLDERGEKAGAASMYAAQLARNPDDIEARARLEITDSDAAKIARQHPWPAALLDPELAELALRAPAPRDKQGAVVLRDNRRVTVDRRGVASIHHQRAILIQRARAVERFQEATIAFNAARPPQVVRARTLTPDGQAIPVPASGRKVRDPYDGTPLRGDDRTLHLRFEQLEPGAIIEYDVVTHRPHPELPDTWWDRYILANLEPTMEAVYELVVPAGPLRVEAPGMGPPTERSLPSGGRVLVWRRVDIPAVDFRDGSVPVPAVYASNLTTWGAVDGWYDGLFAPRAAVTSQVRELAAELTRGAPDRAARIGAIYRFVEQEIAYLGLEFGVGAYQPRPVDGTLAQRMGDCKDKTALMVALLEALGIESHPALVRPGRGGRFMPQHPSPGQFNHVLLHVPGTRKHPEYWLDPTAGLATLDAVPKALRGQDAFVVNGRGGKLLRVPAEPKSDPGVVESTHFALNMTGGGTVRSRVELAGDLAGVTRRRLLAVQSADRDALLASPGYLLGAGRVPQQVAVEGLDQPSAPLALSAELRDPDLVAVRGDGALVLPLEAILLRSGAGMDPASRHGPQTLTRTVRITTPRGYTPGWKPLKYRARTGPVRVRMDERRNAQGIEIRTRMTVTNDRKPSRLHLLQAAQAARDALVDRLVFEPGRGFDKADFYRAMTNEQPENAPLHLLRGRVLLEQERYAEAAEVLSRARDLDPTDGQVQALLAASLIKAHRSLEAVEPLRALTERPETPVAVHMMLITLLVEHERPAEAISALHTARARFPENRRVARRLVVTMAASGDVTGALAEARAHVARYPEDPAAQLLLGDMAAEKGDLVQAEAAYREGLKRLPEDPRLLNNLAWALRDLPERRAEAVALVRKALAVDPQNDAAWDTLAELLYRAGDRPGALEANDQAQRAAPEKAEFYRARRARYEKSSNP